MDQDVVVGQGGTKADPEKFIKARPTLYIGLGGTGMEVMLRVRRRILNASWGTRTPVRLNSLTEFPIAQFLHIDLDQGAVLDSGKAQASDPLVEAIKLPDDDRIVQPFDLQKYCKSDDDLAMVPHVAEWSPMTPRKLRGFDASSGAGQIRAVSRLYFFDKYPMIRESIRNKLSSLKSGMSHTEKLEKLGLENVSNTFRIVVIASIAGGTGSGSFLDTGFLARWLAKSSAMVAEVELMLFLPSGYKAYNINRTQANGYAALMELEPCMMGNKYVERWTPGERPDLERSPYSNIYLLDAGNLANQHTEDVKDVYDMVADALFEEFSGAEFATKKRSAASNAQQFKVSPHHPPMPGNKYGDMKLTYYKGYSAFGNSVLDTQQSLRQDEREFRWAAAMLKSFFGLDGQDPEAHQANDKKRDAFLEDHLKLGMALFDDFPEFAAKVELKLSSGPFQDWQITEDLLTDPQGALQAGLQQKVNQRLEDIGASSEKETWPKLVRDAMRMFERDAIRDQDTAANTSEDRIGQRRAILLEKMSETLRDRLFDYLDNKEYGGLQYVLSLVELIKDRFDNPELGMSAALELNARRYQEIRDALKTHEIERLLKNLEEACGKGFFGLGGGKVEQAKKILGQLEVEIGNYLKFHVRYVAATAASGMLRDLSKRLGEKSGIGADGQISWTGIVQEFQAGREAVLEMNGEIDKLVVRLNDDSKKKHATYLFIAPVRQQQISLPGKGQLRDWAEEAFKDFGGSKKIFPMLKDVKERDKLLRALRAKAGRELALTAKSDQPDPLIEALAAESPEERGRLFSAFVLRSMPWIEGHIGDVDLKSGQCKCYIGVSSAADWKQFEGELKSQVPASGWISSAQVQLVDTGIKGRAVSYCELTGIPLTVLAGLESWRTSYRQESEKIPLHTHKDPTQFVHPLVPSTSDLSELAEDLKLFLMAVMLRVLTRENRTTVPPGLYVFDFGRGDRRSLGNERAFRLNGLPPTSRNQVLAAVNDRKDELDGVQIAALSVLAHVYAHKVYAPRKEGKDSGEQLPIRGFASAMALALNRELEELAGRKGISEEELKKIQSRLEDYEDPRIIDRWTEIVGDSNQDAYPWEVEEYEEDKYARLKRRVRKEFFEPGWLQTILSGNAGGHQIPGNSLPSTPPPVLQAPGAIGVGYYYQLNGQQLGPMPIAIIQQLVGARVLSGAVMAWRDGLPTWLPLGQIPECASLFGPPPISGGAGGPPPMT